jgi:hypothetical protein
MSLNPEAPVHVATDSDITKSAVTWSGVPGSSTASAIAAWLSAVLPDPMVTESRTSASASWVCTDRGVASISPPLGGSWPVSPRVSDTKGKGDWTDKPNARPLNVVAVAAWVIEAKVMRVRRTPIVVYMPASIVFRVLFCIFGIHIKFP